MPRTPMQAWRNLPPGGTRRAATGVVQPAMSPSPPKADIVRNSLREIFTAQSSRFVVHFNRPHPDVAVADGMIVELQGDWSRGASRAVLSRALPVGVAADGLMILHDDTVKDHCGAGGRDQFSAVVKVRHIK